MKHCLLFLMICILVLPLSGCMDALDINKKLIVTTVAADKVNDDFFLYAEVANIQASSSNGSGGGAAPLGSKFFYVIGSGKTLEDARLEVDRQLDFPIFISGVRTLLITERFADDDSDLLTYLYRVRSDETYRKKVLTVTTRSNLDEMFDKMNKKNFSVGYSIENTVTSLEQQGEAFSRTTSRILENISSRYSGVLIPCIGMKDDETILVGYSVVNSAKVTGYIPIEDCKGLNILKAVNAKTFFSIPYQDKIYTVKGILDSKTITPFYQNGEISCIFKLQFKSTVEYANGLAPYHLDSGALKEMEGRLRQTILEEMNKTVNQAQTVYKTDYLQMDDAFRIKYPSIFDELDWQTAFLSARVYWDIKTDLHVTPSMNYESDQTR